VAPLIAASCPSNWCNVGCERDHVGALSIEVFSSVEMPMVHGMLRHSRENITQIHRDGFLKLRATI
jgi:hypothetical protein